MYRNTRSALLAMLTFACLRGGIATADDPPAELVWHDDYRAAVRQAKQRRQMLLIYFQATGDSPARDKFLRKTLADPALAESLGKYTLAKIPVDAELNVGGEEIELFGHAAFEHMQGRQGIVIIDHQHQGTSHFGHVVSQFPFPPGRYFATSRMAVILDLPPGTLTQRTMIYAVRTHAERPASTQGRPHAVLVSATERHSQYQADIASQGHHNWDSRFHEINGQLPDGLVATEVCAESWPNQGLVEAAVECVHSWRQSSGHWSGVRRFHPIYGYDMKRGRNRVWYATGIFANR